MEIALKYQSTFFMFKASDKQIISSLNRLIQADTAMKHKNAIVVKTMVFILSIEY